MFKTKRRGRKSGGLAERLALAEAQRDRLEARIAALEKKTGTARDYLTNRRKQMDVVIAVLRERMILRNDIPRLFREGKGPALISALLFDRHGIKIQCGAIQKRLARLRSATGGNHRGKG